MTPLPPCFSESAVPAEQSCWQDSSPILEEDSKSCAWDPNFRLRPRLLEAEAIPLEMRGITSHRQEWRPSKPASLRQKTLWKRNYFHKLSVAAHLRQAGLEEEALKLEYCHTVFTVCSCNKCSQVRKFPNRCDLFYCPECANHLQAEADKQVSWWAVRVKQPKHVVLTIRNIRDLTPQHVDEFRAMFGKLRRRKFARNWRGGFYRIQITNDGKGWHVHLHALVDAKWIDGQQLKQEWLSATKGFGYIVHVKDARPADYLKVVTRYIVSGNQIAAWSAATTKTFVRAFQNKRTFGVFGSLYGARTEFSEWLATLKLAKPRCDCGSHDVTYWNEHDWTEHCNRAPHQYAPRPPPMSTAQISLVLDGATFSAGTTPTP